MGRTSKRQSRRFVPSVWTYAVDFGPMGGWTSGSSNNSCSPSLALQIWSVRARAESSPDCRQLLPARAKQSSRNQNDRITRTEGAGNRIERSRREMSRVSDGEDGFPSFRVELRLE